MTTATAITCGATTKAGKPCRNRATAGDTCRRHIGQADTSATDIVSAPEPAAPAPTHTITEIYGCGCTELKVRSGAEPTGFDKLALTVGEDGSWVQTWKFTCDACHRARLVDAATCQHERRHLQDGDFVCADCHIYLGTQDVPVTMTPAQAQAVYGAGTPELITCPGHAPLMDDCECHDCMAQLCNCMAVTVASATGVTAGQVYTMARLLGSSGLLRQPQPAQQQGQQVTAVPSHAELVKISEETGFDYRRPGQYQTCAYCRRRYRVRQHFCESPYNPCNACMLCPGCMPCAECGMMDCDPRGSCLW